jgi:hypothetical protein
MVTRRHRIQIDMFRPIRVDHTNCLQVAIKTHSFILECSHRQSRKTSSRDRFYPGNWDGARCKINGWPDDWEEQRDPRTGKRRPVETSVGSRHRHHSNGTTLNPSPRYRELPRDFYLDEPCAVKGFVSVTPTSIVWKDRAGGFDVKLTQGVATSIHAQYSWTIPSGPWTHRRTLFRGDPEELVRLFHRDRVR